MNLERLVDFFDSGYFLGGNRLFGDCPPFLGAGLRFFVLTGELLRFAKTASCGTFGGTNVPICLSGESSSSSGDGSPGLGSFYRWLPAKT